MVTVSGQLIGSFSSAEDSRAVLITKVASRMTNVVQITVSTKLLAESFA